MEKKEYDEDLFEFFSRLLDDDIEIDLLKNIMSGIDNETIIKNYIDSIGEQEDD